MSGGHFSLLETHLGAVHLVRSPVFGDDRGHFVETWSDAAFAALGIGGPFVQDNLSRSRRGVLRGLHWQGPPSPQAKLVRCTAGRIRDVVVDIRGGSPTFGKWAGFTLEGPGDGRTDLRALYIPAGFAHGFLALTEGAEVHYKVTAPWHREAEGTLRWDDPGVGIDWGADVPDPILSARDRAGLALAEVRRRNPFPHGGAP